ncbi:hydantoinase B/oxoprolinase family protein [Halorussus salinisoli]|uniref:hydantoinase B/oxoprolinase family protein n=1 Tax=Halorussus salinisoli TaxID=2558242 RepID=UPI0010C16499|nr:hydantoinase B/oxoprolinase family protein [Halorussus salinisoli]
MRNDDQSASAEIEPYLVTVLAKKFESISREMTQSLLRSARSAVINAARDFSSGITLYDGRTFMIDEGLPVHLANIHFHPQYTLEKFDDISPGDCFLTNSPYAGNTHHADYTLYAPVFFDGEPLFWSINRAHQADVGAPEPTTYLQNAETIYQEGPHFPAVRIQEDYEDKDDIVRMCKLNIRAGETQWYGDYLAQTSAVRTGEERIQELCEEYGTNVIKAFIEEWLRYGEEMMIKEIGRLPEADFSYTTYHDPIYYNDAAPEGIPITVDVSIKPDKGRILVDFTDNIDNIPAGVNLSEATVTSSAYGGVFCNLDPDLPHNHGSISRIDLEMDEGKVVGKPEYPVGTSCATSNVNDMLFNAVRAAFGELGEPYGFAEGNAAMPPNWGVISGFDDRRDGEQYANQLFFTGGGGGAVHGHDGWVTYGTPDTCGVLYRDSVEVDEQKYPILVRRNHLLPDTEGAGTWRGSSSGIVEYGPHEGSMTVAFHGTGFKYPPKGINGGESGASAAVKKRTTDGEVEELSSPGVEELDPGEFVIGVLPGGGGYGDPTERDPELVRADVEAGLISIDRAEETYGVEITETDDGDIIVRDEEVSS